MQEELDRLIAFLEARADTLDKTAESQYSGGTWGTRVLKVRVKDHRRFVEYLKSLKTGDTVSEAPTRTEGSGPYPGPCRACGNPANSWEPFCPTCRGIDDDHYIDPKGNVVKVKLKRDPVPRHQYDMDRLVTAWL